MLRNFLLANVCFAPDGVDGGGVSDINSMGGNRLDDMGDDVLAAWDELTGGDEGGEDGSTQGLGDGRATERETTERQARDGQQAKTTKDDQRPAERPEPRADQRRDGQRDQRGEQPRTGQQPAGPPTSFSPASKAAWDHFKQAYPAIAADIAKREGETAQGLAALRDYKDLKPYADMASQSGTTLAAALHRFTNLENLTRRNPVQGMISVCQSLQMSQQEAASTLLRAAELLGARLPGRRIETPAPANGGQAPDRNGAEPDPFIMAMRPFLAPMLDRLAAMEGHLNGFSAADRNAKERTLDSAITAFASDPENVFFPDVEETITDLFQRGMVPLTGDHAADLRKAYDMATRIHPEVSEALIERRLGQRGGQRRSREQEIADRARRASRSLAGSHAADLERDSRPTLKPGMKPTDDIMADAEAAYNMVAGNGAY